ncbi:MAG: hypothetical protein ACXABO_14930 [Promethearchaeota archaeon]|jgi:hypothetical protein
MSERAPPTCFICQKKGLLEETYYCICDIAVCSDCINSVKKNENIWVCPHCKEENNLEESKLFRAK